MYVLIFLDLLYKACDIKTGFGIDETDATLEELPKHRVWAKEIDNMYFIDVSYHL